MTTTIEATYDGAVFRPTGPVPLAPDTLVRLTVEPLPAKTNPPYSFIDTALSLQVEGPPDWATNLEAYLDGEESHGAG